MSPKNARPAELSGAKALDSLVKQALDVVKKAKKHRQNLQGDNFYGNKLAELRIEATTTYQKLGSRSPGDTTALAEMIQEVFSATTERKRRHATAQDLSFALNTTWRESSPSTDLQNTGSLFPLTILESTNRAYLVSIGRQMNNCYAEGWYDACAVMMRRLVENSIIEAYEGRGISDKIKDKNGNYLQLSELVKRSLAETTWHLERNTKTYLPQLRNVGHQSAHGRFFNAKKEDIDKIQHGCRSVIEEFLHHSNLLTG